MGDNRPPRYVEEYQGGTRVIYRASSLGMCDKVFVALAMGYDPMAHPAWFQEILDEGTEQEATIRTMYEDSLRDAWDDVEVKEVGKVLEMEIMPGIWIRGSIDGWLDTLVVPTIFDAKKIRDSGWQRYLRSGVEFQANYPMQFSAYIHMWEEMFGVMPAMVMVGGHFVQDEKTGQWSVTEVEPHSYLEPMVNLIGIKKVIARRERLINETEAIGDMACTTVMFPCPFYYLHSEDADEPPTRPSDDIVQPILTQWSALEAEKQTLSEAVTRMGEIQKEQKKLQEGIKGWLEASGQESGDVSTVTVGNEKIALKYLTFSKAGYPVKPSEQTRVTIKVVERNDQEVAKAPKKSAKKLAPKVTPEQMAKLADDE